MREKHMRKLGWRVLRFTNRDIYDRLDDVLDVIAVQAAPPSPLRGPPSP